MHIYKKSITFADDFKNELEDCKKYLALVSEYKGKLNDKDTGNVTISVGVATFPQNGEEPQALIEYADKGLYYAKEHGRNQVKCINE